MIWLENIVRLVVLLFLQLLLLNNLHFVGICNPCIYVFFLIALPAELPSHLEQVIGAAVGALMDMACNTPGVHLAACVALSFLRPKLLHSFVPDSDRLLGTLSPANLDVTVYAKLVVVLVLVHHTILFSLANLTWHNAWLTLLQILFSAFLTSVMILGYALLKR